MKSGKIKWRLFKMKMHLKDTIEYTKQKIKIITSQKHYITINPFPLQNEQTNN